MHRAAVTTAAVSSATSARGHPVCVSSSSRATSSKGKSGTLLGQDEGAAIVSHTDKFPSNFAGFIRIHLPEGELNIEFPHPDEPLTLAEFAEVMGQAVYETVTSFYEDNLDG